MYKKILVPLDGSELAECTLPHADFLCGVGNVQEMVLMRVAELLGTGPMLEVAASPDALRETMRKADEAVKKEKVSAKAYLDKVITRFKSDHTKLHPVVLEGRPAEIISDYAEKNGVDLIIIATHGRSGVSRWVRGSTADRILHSARVPVLMVQAPGCLEPARGR